MIVTMNIRVYSDDYKNSGNHEISIHGLTESSSTIRATEDLVGEMAKEAIKKLEEDLQKKEKIVPEVEAPPQVEVEKPGTIISF